MSNKNISLPVAQALASALEKIEAYVPTEYVDNSEPDIDAEHLNHAEQGIMRVTNLLNAAVDVIQGQESRILDAETKIGNAETKIGTAALTGGMTDLSSGVNSLYSNLAISKTSISINGYTQSIWFYKTGNIVCMSSNGNFSTLKAGNTECGTVIPNGYRPVVEQNIQTVPHNWGAILLTISSGGVLNIYNYGAAISAATPARFFGIWATN